MLHEEKRLKNGILSQKTFLATRAIDFSHFLWAVF